MTARHEVLNGLLALFQDPAYLEVGVSEGETFRQVRAARKVAVDPRFAFSPADPAFARVGCEFHEVTSDRYFAEVAGPEDGFDVVYLDGLHTFEQTLRDFENALEVLRPAGVIVIDDVVPNSYEASLPDQRDSMLLRAANDGTDHSWMGDTFKLVYFIEAFHRRCRLRTLSDNHGQAVVWRDRPATRARDRTVRSVASLSYVDVVVQPNAFHFGTFEEILGEFTAHRRARAAVADG